MLDRSDRGIHTCRYRHSASYMKYSDTHISTEMAVCRTRKKNTVHSVAIESALRVTSRMVWGARHWNRVVEAAVV